MDHRNHIPKIYSLLHECRFKMKTTVAIISHWFPFRSFPFLWAGWSIKGFGISSLSWIRILLPFSFLMVFEICLSFCMRSKCTRFGIFKCAYFDEIILLMHQRMSKIIQWGHLPSCTSCRSYCVECRDKYCIL